jgi:hypothetical protein
LQRQIAGWTLTTSRSPLQGDDSDALTRFFAEWGQALNPARSARRRWSTSREACESGNFTVVTLRSGGKDTPIIALAVAYIDDTNEQGRIARMHIFQFPLRRMPEEVLSALVDQFAELAELPCEQVKVAFRAYIPLARGYTPL